MATIHAGDVRILFHVLTGADTCGRFAAASDLDSMSRSIVSHAILQTVFPAGTGLDSGNQLQLDRPNPQEQTANSGLNVLWEEIMTHLGFLLASSALAGVLLASPAAAQVSKDNPLSSGSAAATFPAVAQLTASDGVAGNALGIAVAVSDDTIVVGEDCFRISGNPYCDPQHQGVAYVYQKSGDRWSSMVQTAALTPSDGFVGDEFGTSVAISGDTILVGANNGKVYVFVEPDGGWKDMTETAQLVSKAIGNVYFGVSIAIDKGTAVVGASSANIHGVQQGAAYVFVKPAAGWTTTSTFKAQLTASDGSAGDTFGLAVSVSGDTIAVGAPFHKTASEEGEVYAFAKTAGGWTNATETARFTRSNPGPFDEFGLSVGVSRNTIVAGATQATTKNGQGAVDIFVRSAQGWTSGTETAELGAPDSTGNFGFSVAIAGPRVVVGSFSISNLIFVYAKPAGAWQSTSEPNFELGAGDGISFFGFSLGITSNTVVSGAPYESVSGQTDQGAAYVFSD